jgi:hypothetical protein
MIVNKLENVFKGVSIKYIKRGLFDEAKGRSIL